MADETSALRHENEQLRRQLASAPRWQPSALVLTLISIVIAAGPLLVSVTAYIAPLRDDLDRIEAQMEQLRSETLTKDLQLSERIDRIASDMERNNRDLRVLLAEMQGDLRVIRFRSGDE